MRTAFLSLLGLLLLSACSGVETIPDDSAAFAASGFTRYAWRSEPPSQSGHDGVRLYEADKAIRAGVDERLAELGYQRVGSRDEAQFLIDYVAAVGVNEGRLPLEATNVTPYPSATINRQANQATVDNAYALGGVKETGNIMLVFVDADSVDPLWRVRISRVIEDANRVNSAAIKRAMRQGLSTIPSLP